MHAASLGPLNRTEPSLRLLVTPVQENLQNMKLNSYHCENCGKCRFKATLTNFESFILSHHHIQLTRETEKTFFDMLQQKKHRCGQRWPVEFSFKKTPPKNCVHIQCEHTHQNKLCVSLRPAEVLNAFPSS